MIDSWHCDYEYQVIEGTLDSYPVVSASDCIVTASTTIEVAESSSTVATTTAVLYGDWLIVNMWIVFLLAILALGFFFSNFRKK